MTNRLVITLIHGTWATRSKWTRNGSLLYQELQTRFPTAMIRRFPWSGGNSAKARASAAVDLAREILEVAADPELGPHFLIAHSHGGNVAVQAVGLLAEAWSLGNPPSANRAPEAKPPDFVSGIICLATPFLAAAPGDQTSGADRVLFLMAGFATFVAGIPLAGWADRQGNLAGLMFLLGALVSAFAARRLYGRIPKIRRSYAGTVLSRLWNPLSLDSSTVLIVRPSGDEANGALTFARFSGWLALYGVRRLEALFARIDQTLADGTEIRLLVAIPLFLLGFVLDLANHSLAWPTIALGIILVFGRSPLKSLLGMVSSLLTLPLLIVIAITRLPFGWDIALCSFALDIAVEPVPAGFWQVYQTSLKPIQRVDTGLSHSRIYDEGVVLETIGAWISARLGL